MKTRCLVGIALVALFAGSAAEGQTAARRLRESGEWFDYTRNVTNAIKPGMTSARVQEIIGEKRPGDWRDSSTLTNNKVGLMRCPMGNGSVLVLGFEGLKDEFNIGDDAKLIFIHTVQFSDLKSEIPEGHFEPLRLIHFSPSISRGFDPVSLLRAVNGLHALGKEKALRALREYSRLAGERDGELDIERMVRDNDRAWIYNIDGERVFLIARLLFKRTDGVEEMPQVVPGRVDKDWPLYPLVVSDEVPFLMISGYALAGAKTSPARHLDYCEQNCALRKSPMRPADSPMKAAEHTFASRQWKALFPDEKEMNCRYAKALLREQAIRCVEEFFAPTSGDYMSLQPNCASGAENDRTWQKFQSRLEQVKTKWSPANGRYVK